MVTGLGDYHGEPEGAIDLLAGSVLDDRPQFAIGPGGTWCNSISGEGKGLTGVHCIGDIEDIIPLAEPDVVDGSLEDNIRFPSHPGICPGVLQDPGNVERVFGTVRNRHPLGV